MVDFKTGMISGWGNYPRQECHLYRPEKIKELQDTLDSNQHRHYIARGLGRSYGDTALNNENGVILNTKLNRFIDFDPESGMVECEAGVTLQEIIECVLPAGYFVPVTPGTKHVTVGGAIANDVHGKNHHRDGSFANHIDCFQLLTPTSQMIHCSRDENADLFWATIGGIGLTGILVSARIQLMKVDSAYIRVDYQHAADIDEALHLFSNTDEHYQYSVAWVDGLASRKSLGRSIVMRGNHARNFDLPRSISDPLHIPQKKKWSMPFHLPSLIFNRSTMQLFNSYFYRSLRNKSQQVVDYDSYFYPLDSILHWNRIYGKKGFVQYQVLFPVASSRDGLVQLLETMAQFKQSSFLAVLKRFGKGNKGLLSFPVKGYTLALDIPLKDRSVFSLLRKLDDLVLRYGGRVYLGKDSRLEPEIFAQMYPSVTEFNAIKRQVDPDHLLLSSMSRRLEIGKG